jgi:hypothetical protein
MKKTINYCDICGKETKSEQLSYFSSVDVCVNCQRTIISKVIENKLLDLRPWCKQCNGTGKVEESDCEPYGRVVRTYHECKECKI